jgi:hypothetical protein
MGGSAEDPETARLRLANLQEQATAAVEILHRSAG